jgi:HD superfamily phosphohydrolase
MHVASRLYDSIVASSVEVLRHTYAYTDLGLARDRQKVRLAALLHDIGHSPFSHGSEELFPERVSADADNPGVDRKGPRKHFRHEDYSVALIRETLRTAIDEDEWNRRNYGITADEVAAIIEGSPKAGPALFWRDVLSGQLDADRMDYLLRDSHHIGVNYGRYDLHRLISTARAFSDPDRDQKAPRVGVSSGGWHAAEALILARYSMHKQVYFHKTRLAYDVHLKYAMQHMLPGGKYPLPTKDGLTEYIKWDDWRVLGVLAENKAGEHGERLLTRNHYRLAYQTRENPRDLDELQRGEAEFKAVKEALGDLVVERKTHSNNWYKHDTGDIPVQDERNPESVKPLSDYSSLLRKFVASDQELLYVRPEDAAKSKEIVRRVVKLDHSPQMKIDFPGGKRKDVANVS